MDIRAVEDDLRLSEGPSMYTRHGRQDGLGVMHEKKQPLTPGNPQPYSSLP